MKFMTWNDIADVLGCGRNKALKILHMQPGLIYVGRTPMVSAADFRQWLSSTPQIKVDWSPAHPAPAA